jgi:hypothetical protein
MLSSNPFLDDDGRPPPPTPPFPPAVEKKAYATRLSEEKQKDNVNDMLKREGDLIFMSPILPGFSLKSKLWRKLPIQIEILYSFVSLLMRDSQLLHRRYQSHQVER